MNSCLKCSRLQSKYAENVNSTDMKDVFHIQETPGTEMLFVITRYENINICTLSACTGRIENPGCSQRS